MDSWTEHFDLARWQQRLAEAHDAGELPDMDTLLGSRDPDGPLPWDHLDMGVTRSYLLGERAAALAASERPDCSDGICDACGVCPEEPLHRLTPDPPRRPPSTAPARGDVDSTATQVRLFFSKTDRARLISHLEMVNTFERAARRARLPLSFSRGYHPKAKLRFTPALPLGAESRCEFLELGLGRSMDPADVQRRLAAQLPVGLTILRAETVQDNILKKITGIRWRLTLPRHAGPAVVAARQELAAGGLVLNRKRAAPRSLSKIILNLEAEGNDVDVSCRFDSGGTVKPSELLDVLFHLDAREQQAVKISREDWLLESTQ